MIRSVVTYLFLAIVSIFAVSSYVFADCDGNLPSDINSLQSYIENCQSQVNQIKTQKDSLAAAVSILNSQISLAQAQINKSELELQELEKDIQVLSSIIASVATDKDSLNQTIKSRIRENYRRVRSDLHLALITDSLSQALSTVRYLAVIRQKDALTISELEKAQQKYYNRKEEKTTKQEQVIAVKTKIVAQRQVLSNQQREKQQLLLSTQNNEKRYQTLLSEAKKELEALVNSQFTGTRKVSKGEIIGVMGSTGFSTGAHLHFGYYDLSESDYKENYLTNASWYSTKSLDPRLLLSPKTVTFSANSCFDVTETTSKSYGTGSASWPMSNPRITQCHGKTPYSYWYQNKIHDGLDMTDTQDTAVRSVEEGTAYFYKGSGSFGNNVRVFHPSGKMTLYLHLK